MRTFLLYNAVNPMVTWSFNQNFWLFFAKAFNKKKFFPAAPAKIYVFFSRKVKKSKKKIQDQ